MKTRFSLIALAATAALLAVVAAAQAAPAPAPAWGVLAATGPTHLAPEQSETQRIAVEAEGGEFTLSQVNEAEGHLSYGRCYIFPGVAAGATELTCSSFVPVAGEFEDGQEVTSGSGIAGGTTIAEVTNGGKTIKLSQPTTGETKNYISFGLKEVPLSSGNGVLQEGEEVTGSGIPGGTTVTATDTEAETITLSNYPTQSGNTVISATHTTAALPYNAPAAEVQSALETALGASIKVTGGPGGDTEHPYFVTFLADTKDHKPFIADAEELEGAHKYVHVFTTVPGGPGTGFIGVFATNFGAAPTSGTGEVTVEVGPLPAGIAVPEASTHAGWSCGKAEPGEAFTCSSTAVVPAFTQATPIKVPVEVRAGAAAESSAQVTVSGAGGEATYAMPIVVSTEPAPPGIAAFTFGFYEADGSLSTQAGGHPYSSSTEFILNSVRVPSGSVKPAGDAREVIVDLPAGLVGNPLVVKRCPQSQLTPEAFFEVAACPAAESESLLGTFEPMLGFANSSFPFGIYSSVPARGTAAQFTSKNVSPIVALFGSLRSEGDFGPRVTAPNAATQLEQVISGFTVFYGFPEAAHGKAFFTNPSDCAEQARKTPQLRTEISTWQHPDDFSVASVPVAPVTGCGKLSFHPGFSFQPSSTQGSSGVGAEAHLHMDQSGLTDAEQLGPPPLKRSVVKLPEGLTINPAQANGLKACSEAQVGYKGSGELPNPTRFNNDPVSCPDASKLGTAEATSPLLDEPLKGTIYLAKQDENPFHTLIGLYLVFESPRFGITLKLPGRIDPDPNTGQLTATFDYLPQQPVEDFTLHFRGGGPHSELATPEVCGTYTTNGSWEPWSAPESGPPAQTSDSFNVSTNCASSPGARPFNPSFEAGSTDPVAGAYSPLVIKIGRGDGEQELDSLDFTMPPGITGKLAGIPYCSDGDIAAAQGKSGKEEQASSSCPAASKLGSIDAAAGVGSDPFHVGGDLYLAGPYKGAPLSAVAITPAVAGPFDLGNVVIRTPLKVDPVTAQITANSDPIPTSLEGIPLKVRSVAIDIDRSEFTLNPTSCEAMQVTASIHSSDGATSSPSNRFQVGGCKDLSFEPKTYFRLFGGTGRGAHPKVRAIYVAKHGEANLAKGAFTIPRSEFLDQAHIRTVCTRVQFAADKCPKGAIYGHVKAFSPIVGYPLTGPVYLRSSNHELPDMVFDLHGPDYQPVHVTVGLRIDSIKGQIRVTAEDAPDVPVSKLIFVQQGGKKGLLINSRNICRRHYRANVATEGHNGKTSRFKPVMSNSRCAKQRKAKRKHKRHQRRSGRRSQR